MKTWLLAAMVAAGLARPAAAGTDMDAANRQGEALQVFVTPLTAVGVTQFQISALVNTSQSIAIAATIYWIEAEVVRETATSSTGWALFSWSASTTGGMTSAAGANGAWNHQHFVPFGVRGNDTVGADDELIRYGHYSEGTRGQPIRRVYPTVYIGSPQSVQKETGDVIQILIRYGTQPYGVNPGVRTQLGSS